MRDYYLCYPAILTNTLVPQPGLSSILQNQLGVALDALTVMPNTLCLWVFWALSSQGSLSQMPWRWVALKRQKPCTNAEQPPIYGVGGGLFIARRQPDLICQK